MFSLFRRESNRPTVCPIGIDLGSRHLKLVQVRLDASRDATRAPEVIASATTAVPEGAWGSPAARRAFFAGAVRRLVRSGRFEGRRAVLAMPAAATFMTGLRLPPVPAAFLGEAVIEAIEGSLAFPASHARVRHITVGDAYDGNQRCLEVIAMAVRGGLIEDCLAAAAAAGLEIVGVTPEPLALLSALPHAGAATNPASRGATMIVDLCAQGARVYVAEAGQLIFARCLVGYTTAGTDAHPRGTSLPIDWTADDLRMCRHYVDAARPGRLSDVLFVGGGARDLKLCKRLAAAVGLPARAADAHADLAVALGASIGTDQSDRTGEHTKAA